jgi:plasmid stabilization system protein ParE
VADVVFHPEAQAEYDAARAWYQARSPQTAARFEAEVERVVGLIGASPEMFPSYDDDHRFAVLRRFPYSLIYQVQPTQVFVVAVAHSSRAAGYWQGRA